MKILEARDGFIKIESNEKLSLSSFIRIDDSDKTYIAQVVQSKLNNDINYAFAKILFNYNDDLCDYDKTLPSKNATLTKFDFNLLNQTFAKTEPVVIGNFIDKDSEIKIEKSCFTKKMLVCIDSNEKNKIVTTNIAGQVNNSIIIDTLGIIDSSKFVAGIDFKLPLNTSSLEFIFEECLNDATSDSKNLIKEVFQNLSEYSKTVPFVPFGALKTIVDDMVDKSHVFKLLVLKNKLSKFEKLGYFANTQAEASNLNNILKTNNCIIDLSKLDSTFQNRYLKIILSIIEQQNEKPILFFEASNNINKTNLKKIIAGSIPSVFITHSRFKYINEIKTMFSNFIIEPSFVNNTTFKSFATLLNSVDKNSYLIIGEATNNIPLISKAIKRTVPQKTEIIDIHETINNTDLKELEENLEKQDPTFDAIEKKSDEIIEKVAEEINNENISVVQNIFQDETSENQLEENIEDNKEFLDSEEEIPETELAEENSGYSLPNEPFISSEDSIEEIPAENFIETEETNDTEIIIEHSDEIASDIEILDTEDNNIEELSFDNTQDSENIEINEHSFEENLITETELELSEENNYETVENSEDYIEEIEITDYEEETNDIEVSLDEEEYSEESLINIEEVETTAEIEEQNEALEKAIVEDVDKVFTTIKEDSISDEDLDFIDELNNSTEDEELVLSEGMEELTEMEELEETDDTILEPLNEVNDSMLNSEKNEEILETKSSTTPMVPVYSAEIPAEDRVESDNIEQGDIVFHAKYGNGIVEKMIKYGNKTLYSINFDNIGRRLLDPTLTEIKKG